MNKEALASHKFDTSKYIVLHDGLKRCRQCMSLIEAAKKKRTLNQNSFFHGPFLDALEAMYCEAGNDHSREEIKEQMKQLFGLKKTIIAPGGMETTVLVSTTKYSTTEIEAFMDKIRAWAAPYNKILPYPNEGRYAAY